jgi:hypothetical protein
MMRLRSRATGSMLLVLVLALEPPACSAENDAAHDGKQPAGQDLAAGEYAGHCAATPPHVSTGSWRHSIKSRLDVLEGAPNHRVQDAVVLAGKGGTVRARFAYGLFDKDLEDEDVQVFIQTCPGWENKGTLRTDGDGRVTLYISPDQQPGDYRVRFVVLGDGTSTEGEVAVWRPGVRVVVSDVDGTLTTSDFEAVKDVLLGADANMFPDANAAMSLWEAQNHRLVYLTARPQILSRYSRAWLDEHGFPRGILHLTDSTIDLLASDGETRAFKADYLRSLTASLGVQLIAAYGNAATDIAAYADVGVPKARTFTIGSSAGDSGTQPLPDSYTGHLATISAFGDAVQP